MNAHTFELVKLRSQLIAQLLSGPEGQKCNYDLRRCGEVADGIIADSEEKLEKREVHK